jgi:class 3 adenylate cyclase
MSIARSVERHAGGVELFLTAYATDSAVLRKALARVPGRVRQFRDGDRICNAGDEAAEFWLVLSGNVRVETDKGVLLVAREAGEIVGEQAFYRSPGPAGRPVRGARMTALGRTKLQIIDAAFLTALTDTERVVWSETMNRVLSAKLDAATAHRTVLHEDGSVADALLAKFVCEDGLAAARSAVSSGRIDPEQCDCIIWFSDLAGFSKYALTLAPSESGALVRELMEVQAAAIESAGGQIDKFMGDGLMAFWRVPGDGRKRVAANGATQAAIEAAEVLTTLFRERGLPLDIRIGLHVGPVIVGDFGGGPRIAFTCIGEAVNTASRYEQASRRIDGGTLGRVRMSPALWSHVSDSGVVASFDEVAGAFEDKHRVSYPVYSLKV